MFNLLTLLVWCSNGSAVTSNSTDDPYDQLVLEFGSSSDFGQDTKTNSTVK